VLQRGIVSERFAERHQKSSGSLLWELKDEVLSAEAVSA
jgi:hypothetical protein